MSEAKPEIPSPLTRTQSFTIGEVAITVREFKPEELRDTRVILDINGSKGDAVMLQKVVSNHLRKKSYTAHGLLANSSQNPPYALSLSQFGDSPRLVTFDNICAECAELELLLKTSDALKMAHASILQKEREAGVVERQTRDGGRYPGPGHTFHR